MLFWGEYEQSLIPDRDLMTDQTTDIIQVIGELMSFIGVTSRTMGEGLLMEQKLLQSITAAHPSMGRVEEG